MPDIFLSYNREDQALARVYADAFAAEGFEVWWDTALRSGEAYDEVTEAALRGAKAVVVLWSSRSVVSRWVRAEATLADRNRTLLPAMIEACERPIMFELVQTADLIGWQGDRSAKPWRAFVEDAWRFVERDDAARAATRPPPPAPVATAPVPVIPEPLPLPAKPSLAVMPFANMSGDPADDYFADGMVVEIVTALSHFESLFVISSGSTLSYRGDRRPPGEIARELGVRFILQGSVRKAGQQVRIAVELLDEVALTPIWTQRFDGSLDDIFALQDNVSLAVASQIEPSITAYEVRRTLARPSVDHSAYDLFLRGFHDFWGLWTREGLERATDLFKRAAALDPQFAQAHAYASNALINFVLQGHAEDPLPVMGEAVHHARAALRAGPGDAEVLAIAAYTLFQCEEPQASVDAIVARALALNPGMSRCHYTAGYIALYACRPQEALDAYDAALRLDPRTPWHEAINIGKAQALFQLGRFEEALPRYAQAELAFPDVAQAIRRISALCHVRLGHPERALGIAGVADPITPNEEFLISRYRDPAFRESLRQGIADLVESATA